MTQAEATAEERHGHQSLSTELRLAGGAAVPHSPDEAKK